MLDFLKHILQNTPHVLTVLVVNENSLEDPLQYQVRPRQLRYTLIGTLSGVALVVFLLLVLTPIIEWLPGRSMEEVRSNARRTALRIASLEDSLAVQQAYIVQLSEVLVGGELNLAAEVGSAEGIPSIGEPVDPSYVESVLPSEDWSDHAQPALPVERMPAVAYVSVNPDLATRGYLSSLRLPFMSPVDGGLITRGFNAQIGHYAVDIAVQQGTNVRSVGDGYVIFADWTYSTGFVIAIHHADGYVTVYKHNQRLLKQVGDRVRDRETIAISGNTGEVTTGPHIHFELWHEGLAQDPKQFFIDIR